jgi:hypothetical protein
LPVAARTDFTVFIGKVLATTPRLIKSVIRFPFGSSAIVRAIFHLLE